MDKARNKIHRILEIAADINRTVSRRLADPIKRGIKLPKIFCIENRFNFWISSADLFQFFFGSVSRIIVNKYQFIIILRETRVKFVNYGLPHRNNMICFIKTRNKNANFFH